MKDIIDKSNEFKKLLSEFIIKFSTIEFFISYLCFEIEKVLNPNSKFEEIALKNLSNKKELIKKFITDNLPSLKIKWNIISENISNVNMERKHLVHGIGNPSIYGMNGYNIENLQSFIPKRNQSKSFNLKDLEEINLKIDEIILENGLGNEFYTEFKKELFNWYNLNLAERPKKTV
ncbi:MAG: hypothetical protein A2W99_15965 [Bacteroidetes bacterium GWF2_33_16]|nr:MAG: hypothetical protein A2X00_15310 [Bacteroidetes bacterium GWE2_32_14]OFY02397.1 MAG: hypothetical protein A2W99_15965 [Bacteroidetes bacterium GWF2_33_16]